MNQDNDVYTFKMKQQDGVEIKLQGNDVTLQDLLRDFKAFLKGCGFPYETVDQIQVVEEKTDGFKGQYRCY